MGKRPKWNWGSNVIRGSPSKDGAGGRGVECGKGGANNHSLDFCIPPFWLPLLLLLLSRLLLLLILRPVRVRVLANIRQGNNSGDYSNYAFWRDPATDNAIPI